MPAGTLLGQLDFCWRVLRVLKDEGILRTRRSASSANMWTSARHSTRLGPARKGELGSLCEVCG